MLSTEPAVLYIVEFTCPHCHKTFNAKIRKASTSEKAAEARRRNLEAGGYNRKASETDIVRIFLKKTEWTWQDFVAAVENKTGAVYSRAQAFAVLKKLRQYPPSLINVDGFTHIAYSGLNTPLPIKGKKPDGIMLGDCGLDAATKSPFTKKEIENAAKQDEKARNSIVRKKKIKQRI